MLLAAHRSYTMSGTILFPYHFWQASDPNDRADLRTVDGCFEIKVVSIMVPKQVVQWGNDRGHHEFQVADHTILRIPWSFWSISRRLQPPYQDPQLRTGLMSGRQANLSFTQCLPWHTKYERIENRAALRNKEFISSLASCMLKRERQFLYSENSASYW